MPRRPKAPNIAGALQRVADSLRESVTPDRRDAPVPARTVYTQATPGDALVNAPFQVIDIGAQPGAPERVSIPRCDWIYVDPTTSAPLRLDWTEPAGYRNSISLVAGKVVQRTMRDGIVSRMPIVSRFIGKIFYGQGQCPFHETALPRGAYGFNLSQLAFNRIDANTIFWTFGIANCWPGLVIRNLSALVAQPLVPGDGFWVHAYLSFGRPGFSTVYYTPNMIDPPLGAVPAAKTYTAHFRYDDIIVPTLSALAGPVDDLDFFPSQMVLVVRNIYGGVADLGLAFGDTGGLTFST